MSSKARRAADPEPKDIGGARGLGRNSALMASGSMISRVLGVVRNAMLVACIGGSSAAGTAFATANTLPTLIFMLLSGGLLTSILIPQITKAMKRGAAGQQAIDALLTLAFGVVAAVTVVATLAAAPLITFLQLTGPIRDLGIMFAYLCLPQIFFYGAYAIWGQVLNTRDRYAEYMWTPVLANIIQIAGMAIFLVQYARVEAAERWTPAMVWLLAGTTTLGIAVQALGLLPGLRKSGFKWRPCFQFRGHGFRAVGKLAAWTIVAVTIAQLGGLLTQQAINAAFTRAHNVGKEVANLNIYTQVFTIFMVPVGVISVSILTALYPALARAVQDGDDARTLKLTLQGIRWPAVILIPMTFAAVVLAVPGIGVLNPSMTTADVHRSAQAFSLMAIGFVPFSVSALQQRFSMAREDGRTNLKFQLIITGIQAFTALLVFTTMADQFAVNAVAIGQTLGNGLAMLFFCWLVNKDLGGNWLGEMWRSFVKMAIVSLPATVFCWLCVYGLNHVLPLAYYSYLTELVVGGLVFVFVFFSIAHYAKVAELDEALLFIARRIWRLKAKRNAKAASQAQKNRPALSAQPSAEELAEFEAERTKDDEE